MLLYADILTGDELFSDAFPLYVYFSFSFISYLSDYRKEVDGAVYEVDCQMITVSGAEIDIGRILMAHIAAFWLLTRFRC